MRHRLREAIATLLVMGLVGTSGLACDPLVRIATPPPAELGSYPYHPVVFQLDLAIFAYQLHGQSLVWPFDPFYEERTQGGRKDRPAFMQAVHAWIAAEGTPQSGAPTSLSQFRGPGALGGFPDNASHDPILYDYSRIHPWSNAIVNALSRWTEYKTPREITGRISEVYVSLRPTGAEEAQSLVLPVPLRRDDRDPDATDILVAFEGGTGDKGEAGQPHSQSLMGFVLARDTGSGGYDVHVSFRGSRSGSAARALLDSLSTPHPSGNPDWITDLGWFLISASEGGGHITRVGAVSRGFATSVGSMLPTVFAAFEKISELRSGASPGTITVTGHSLGGALAQHFTSAVLMGEDYGPSGSGPAMPAALSAWPWAQLKLVTFSAPRAGEEQWAWTLTDQHLQQDFYDVPIVPFDPDALHVTDPEIVSRLLNDERPAGFRVLVSTDPITMDVATGGYHVGKTVYVNGDALIGWFGAPSFAGHEPEVVRNYMRDAMGDPRTPPDVWGYHPLTAFAPTLAEGEQGTDAAFEKLADAIVDYHADRDMWFDTQAHEAALELLFRISDDF